MDSNQLRHLFLEIVRCNSIHNDVAANIYFYSLLGAYFRNKIIQWGVSNKDLRVQFCFFQNSRSGKDQINKVVHKLGNGLGLKVVTLTDISGDAAIFGTYDNTAHEYNVSHGLSRDEPLKENKNSKILEYRDPIIKGDLGNYNLILISEGKLLFQTDSSKLLTVLQPALDYPGYVRKKMRNLEPIEYNCDATIIFTSIPFKEMKKSLLDQGYFQRNVVLINRLTKETIHYMRSGARNLRSNEVKKRYEHLSNKFITELLKYDTSPGKLFIGDDANDFLTKLSDKLFEMVDEKMRGPEVSNCLSFTQTAEDMALRMGGINCLLNGRTEITANDIMQCTAPIYHFINTIINELEVVLDYREQSEINKIFNRIKEIIINDGGKVNKTTLRGVIQHGLGLSQSSSKRKIEELINMNYLKETVTKHNTKIITINK